MDPDETLPPEAPPTIPAPPPFMTTTLIGFSVAEAAAECDFDGFASEELDEA